MSLRIKLTLLAPRMKLFSKTHKLMDLGFGGQVSQDRSLFTWIRPIDCLQVKGWNIIYTHSGDNTIYMITLFTYFLCTKVVRMYISRDAWDNAVGQGQTGRAKWAWESKHSSQNLQCFSCSSMWWEEINHSMVGTGDQSVQSKREMACKGKGWLEKHLTNVNSFNRKVKENEGREEKLRTTGKTIPRFLEEFWSHESQS